MKKILKNLIKKILKNNNWKLEKIVQPRDYNLKAPEEVMLTKIRNSKGILHVGAHRGSEAPVYEWFGKKVIWIEANPKIFKSTMLVIGGVWAGNQLLLTFIRDKSFAASLAWAIILGIIALVVYLEKFIEKSIPDGARRHRLLGRATMIIFSLILVTSTLVYLMLYVIYPKI